MTEYNWGAARKAALTVLEGDFPAIVIEAKAGKSTGGKEQIKIQLKITSGQYVGRKLFDSITISPESAGAMAMFFRTMDSLGLDDKFFATCPQGEAGTAQMATAIQGKEVTVTLKNEPYNGQPRERVKGYRIGAGGGGTAPALIAPVTLVAPVPVLTATPPPEFDADPVI